MSHPNETMTKEQIATEFRRSMDALEECIDESGQDDLDPPVELMNVREVTNRLDKRIDRLYLTCGFLGGGFLMLFLVELFR